MKPQLVVFEMHHLGDAVMALPFLKVASETFQIAVFCRPETADFLSEAVTGLHVIPSDTWSGVFSKLPKLEKRDTAVCVWPDARAHFAMKQTGAGRRIGFRLSEGNFYGVDRPWRKRRLRLGKLAEKILSLTGNILTEALDRPSGGQTHGESWTQLSVSLGLEPDFSFPWLPLPPPPAGLEEFLSESRSNGNKILAIHTGGRLPGKRWPPDRFQKLLTGFLSQAHIAVAIVKPPGEECPSPSNRRQRIFGTPSLPILASLFSKVDAVLCNDSLASHLASAVGIPTVTIFGSGEPSWFAPYGNASLVLATDACPFRPCVDCCVMPSLVCLESVSIHLVEQKLSAMFPDSLRNPTI